MKRRDFIRASALAAGGVTVMPTVMPSFASVLNDEMDIRIASPMDAAFRIKFINDGIIHEDAWEGSCRFGDLENLTYEAELNWVNSNLDRLKATLASSSFPPGVELLEPVTMFSWVEKGNPDIMLSEEHINKLTADNSITDLYVVSSPYIGYRVAERYKKPVCVLQPHGWGVDGPAGIRNLGLEGFHVTTWEQLYDLTRVLMARKSFANTKLLSVTNFPGRVPWGVVSAITDLDMVRDKYGMDYTTMDYKEFFGYMDDVENDRRMKRRADQMARKLLNNAGSSTMSQENIARSVMFYLTVTSMMERQSCNAFTIECFELCSSLNPWNRKFTPCLSHALLKDAGIPAACEGDTNALLAMMVQKYLSRKAIYMGNPDVDIENNILRLHHSVASLKMFGIDEKPSPYNIHNFMVSGYGATLRHDFTRHIGEKVTVARFDPTASKMLVSAGEVVMGSGMEGCGCALNVEVAIPDGRRFWKRSQDYGHHMAFVYGDYINQMEDLAELMDFEIENVLI